jgi:hypothetical protein
MIVKKLAIVLLSFSLLTSCTKKLDELLVNPNGPTPEKADVDLYLPVIQNNFISVFNSASSFGMELTRMIIMYGPTYNQAYSPNSFDGVWSAAYTGVFKHANELIPIATAQKKYTQASMAKVMKAYTMMTLVDMFGDVPYAEANLGFDNTNPTVTKGSDVYAAAIKLLQEASDTLDLVARGAISHGAYPGFLDNFYGTTGATGARRWSTQAKLFQLRAYMTTRLVDNTAKSKIEALLANADVIASFTGTAQDFEFKFSNKQANPNSRHPRYNGNYNGNGSTTGAAGDYIGTQMLFSLAAENGLFNNDPSRDNSDPRTRYYFYRQQTDYLQANSQTVSCGGTTPPAQYPQGMPFCLINVAGFWGRDHGDNSGIPPDGNLRTTWGIYPAGGEMDLNQSSRVSLNRGGQGAGIHPIWQSSFTDFLRAEAVLSLGVAGDAKALLKSAVEKSISKVLGYPATIGFAVPAVAVPSAARVTAHVNKVLASYDAAATNSDRLNVVMKEWYLASWGNGYDAHNNYRRTGMPNSLQLARLPESGGYIRSFLYPSSYINLNNNAGQQQSITKKVFWDTNPSNLK